MPRRLRRSVMFCPALREDRVHKALASGEADTLVVDLEDSVAPNDKPAARDVMRRVVPARAVSRTELVVRVNGVSTEWHKDDLAAAVPVAPDAIMLPKAERPEDAARVAERIKQLEAAARLPPGKIRLLLIVESAWGVLNAPSLATSSPRVDGLIFGAEDYQVDVGGRRRLPDNLDVLHARSHVSLAAAAARVPAVDQVYIDFNDPEGLRAEAGFARDLGFRGKMAIHPKQLSTIHEVFTPSKGEIDHATRLLAAADAEEKAGRGTFAFEGKMIDRPLVEQARRIMDDARQAGLR